MSTSDSQYLDTLNILIDHPGGLAPFEQRGFLYYKYQLYQRAITDFSSQVENNQSSTAYLYRAYCYEKLGKAQLAKQDYQAVINQSAKNHQEWNTHGLAHRNLKEYQAAVNDFQQALTIAPNHTGYLANLGEAYHLLKQYPQAIAHYTQALKIDPEYAYAYYLRGLTYYSRGQYLAARADFVQACALGDSEGCDVLKPEAWE